MALIRQAFKLEFAGILLSGFPFMNPHVKGRSELCDVDCLSEICNLSLTIYSKENKALCSSAVLTRVFFPRVSVGGDSGLGSEYRRG